MPDPIADDESGASVRTKINAAFTELAGKLGAELATEVDETKAVPIDADEMFVADTEDGTTPGKIKTTTYAGVRKRISTVPNGSGLATTGTIDLDFADLTGTEQPISLTGDPTFTSSGEAIGRSFELVLIAGGSTRTITWPSWTAFGAALPTSLASGKILRVTLRCTGTTDASVHAAAALSV